MQIDSKILDDMVGIFSSVAGTAGRMRKDFDANLRAQFEKIFSSMNVVNRDEFETVKQMLSKSREEQEDLKKRITELENQLSSKR